jgi:phosphotransferase system enzyme I (PtsI)
MVFWGTGVSSGICMANLLVLAQEIVHVPECPPVEDIGREVNYFRDILKAADEELQELYEIAAAKIGEKDAEIFDAHLSILRDEFSVCLPIEDFIRTERCSAAKAIDKQFKNLIESFSSLDDSLMKERAADAADLKDMLLRLALDMPHKSTMNLKEDVIVLANELSPSDTVRMDLSHVAGIATRFGGGTSHMAIIARTLGIPAVAGLSGWEMVHSGTLAVMDGDKGTLICNPSAEEMSVFKKVKYEYERRERELEPFKHLPSVSADGTKLEICANIGTPDEIENVLTFGAEGIGLFRSEFLFMDRGDIPTEEEQYKAYRSVLCAMGDRPVIIRTLDVGGDKSLPALALQKEDNPFLGYRAIRMCLDRVDIFRPQLRALLRAGVHGNLGIMFPMISGLGELRAAKAHLEEARLELEAEGFAAGNVRVGMMIEVPASAIMAARLAGEVDFFSIGTNDLVQYTLAVERGNAKIEKLYSPYHPAVLRLIAMTAKAAAEHGISCGMCGEAAGDPSLAPVFIGLGVTELSMTPRLIPRIRQIVRSISITECRKIAQEAAELADEKQVKKFLQSNSSQVY